MRGRLQGSGFLQRIVRDVWLAVSLLRDYWRGAYRTVPGYSLLALVLATLYVFSPLDVVPDVLPIVGLVDDALVTLVCLGFVEKDLCDYEAWKKRQDRGN
jgi:uncharacterized membrane protein YkvA (DUF1232 family)